MIDRELSNEISAAWRESKSVARTPAARLEAMFIAFLLPMRIIVDAVESVQKLWDTSGLIDLFEAAQSGESLDSGGTITKDAVTKYRILFLAFKTWLNTPVSVTISGNQVTLVETPTDLINRQPEKVETN